jgi:hypothetical protein
MCHKDLHHAAAKTAGAPGFARDDGNRRDHEARGAEEWGGFVSPLGQDCGCGAVAPALATGLFLALNSP